MKANSVTVIVKVVAGIIILVGVLIILVGCVFGIIKQVIPSVATIFLAIINPPVLMGKYSINFYAVWKGILITAAGGGLWILVALLEALHKVSRYLVAIYNLQKPYQPD